MSDQEKQEEKQNNNGTGDHGPKRLSDSGDSVDDPNDSSLSGEKTSQTSASDPASALSSALSDADKFKNEYLYLRAEFENFKKNTIKERSDLRKYGSERLIVDLLSVLDIFETALAANVISSNTMNPSHNGGDASGNGADALANFRKGIEMTAAELKSVLNRHGVTDVPSKGIPFDPVMHEALSSEETSDSVPGTVTQVFKKPYKLHDRVIRPGQVVVAKARS